MAAQMNEDQLKNPSDSVEHSEQGNGLLKSRQRLWHREGGFRTRLPGLQD